MAAIWAFLVAMATGFLYASGDPGSYVIVAPSKIRAGAEFSLSVNILNATEDVMVAARVYDSGSDEDIATATGVFQTGVPKELTLQIPSSVSGSNYYTYLNITGYGGLTFSKKTSIGQIAKQNSLFIQSDKAIYKPGDTVNFRVFGIYSDLKPYLEAVDIDIYDEKRNKIKQWTKQTPTNGVISKSFQLSSQPTLGDWKISVKSEDETEQKIFTVAEYVLPKFEVEVEMPSYVLTSDSLVTATIKATYTYGKPVKGTADVSLVHQPDYYSRYRTKDMSQIATQVQVPLDGEAKVSFSMADVKALGSKKLNKDKLFVIANVTEEQTGQVMSANNSVIMYDNGVKLDFPDTNPDTFKPGLKYVAVLKVTQPDGLPANVGSEPVTISTTVEFRIPTNFSEDDPYRHWRSKSIDKEVLPEYNITVPAEGLIALPLDIRPDAVEVTVKASLGAVYTYLRLDKSHSPSDSYIRLDLLTLSTIQAGDVIDLEVTSTQPLEQLVYQVLSRGLLVQTGTVTSQKQMVQPFTLTTDATMAPDARIVVYYVRADGEIVTDSISFSVSGAFLNKVSVEVDSADAKPGDKVKVSVAADPASVAHLMAVDQSVLLLKSGNDVTADDVMAELTNYDTILSRPYYSYFWGWPTYYGGEDAGDIFNNAGVTVITDCLVYHYIDPYRLYARGRPGGAGGGVKGPQNYVLSESILDDVQFDAQPTSETSSTQTTLRTNFAETWLWTDLTFGTNGTVTTSATIPDTITSWVISAFATNPETGLGVAPTQAQVTVFKPFFVSLNLPYSVTRGENLALQAIVFNYLEQDAAVRVTLAQSEDFLYINVDSSGAETLVSQEVHQDITIKAGESQSVYFPILPSRLGHIDVEVKATTSMAADALRRQLLVEAEGVPKEYNLPVLVDLTSEQSFSQTVDISLPPSTVQGSEYVKISVVGDLMGPSVDGIENLLRMPTGCGEQNMVKLAPDVYLVDYLKAVDQLTPEIKEKALNFMETGYQRELTYKHDDGSFSAFGSQDESGSMWLTAFVTRVLQGASSHTFVDSEVLMKAINWMINQQASDGSFPEPGKMLSKSMQSKAGKGVGLTCFVYLSLLENQHLYADGSNSNFHTAKAKALAYLEAEASKTDDLYVLAMSAYAFTLAGSSQAQVVLDKLEAQATIDGRLRYWSYPKSNTTTSTTTWRAPKTTKAVDTEMSAYVLLTYATRSDVQSGAAIMQWLAQQRNPRGGFGSTQDTVVALMAMSKFAQLTHTDDFNIQITAKLDGTPTYNFNVDDTNSLILQTSQTNSVPKQVTIEATGSGSSLVQIAVFYNVESEVEEVTFDLTVTIQEETVNWLVVETCAKWTGEGDASSMVVQEIGIPSGFYADPEYIPRLEILKRIELENKKIILYFDQIGTENVCLTFRAERTSLVAKSQPAAIRVYDYYEPENQVTGFYQSQTLRESTICELCRECCR